MGEGEAIVAVHQTHGAQRVRDDVDATLGSRALAMLHGAGHSQRAFAAADLTTGPEIPGGPLDVVCARLLLFHVADPAALVGNLWAAVAPGGHLVVHDYDLRTTDVLPWLDSVQEWKRVALGAFTAAGCDIHIGHRLPQLFVEAGLGIPDGADVAGPLEPLRAAGPMIAGVFRSPLPAAVAFGLTSAEDGQKWLDEFDHDVRGQGDNTTLWPLLIGAWKRKPLEPT